MTVKKIRLSPSAADTWMNCPGSVQLLSKMDVGFESTVYSAEGNVAHDMLEKSLKNNLGAHDFKKIIGTKVNKQGFDIKVNQGMIDAVFDCANYVREIEQSYWFAEKKLEVKSLYEYKFPIKNFTKNVEFSSGIADIIVLAADGKKLKELQIIDYKHGAGVKVNNYKNLQLLIYAYALTEHLKKDYKIPKSLKLTLSIVQPRHRDSSIDPYVLDYKELQSWVENELKPKVIEIDEASQRLEITDKGCQFCKVKQAGLCPAVRDVVDKSLTIFKKSADADFEKLKPKTVKELELNPLTVEEEVFIIKNEKIITSFIDKIKTNVFDKILSGSDDYQDYLKLVRSKTNRKFKDGVEDEDFSPLLDYLNKDDIFKHSLKSLTQIEKLLQAKLGKENGAEKMKDLTYKPEGGLSLVSVEDKRPAHNSADHNSAAEDFKQFTN